MHNKDNTFKHINLEQRIIIAHMLKEGFTQKDIAKSINVTKGALSRETKIRMENAKGGV